MTNPARLALSSLFVVIVACGEGGGGTAGSSKPASTSAATSTAAATAKPVETTSPAAPVETAAAVEASDEMKAFLELFKGTNTDVQAALKKYGKPGLDDKDMGDYDLKEPRITRSETKDKQTCYDLEAGAGLTVRLYALCWEAGKIVSVEAKGMK